MTTDRAGPKGPILRGRYTLECECCQTQWRAKLWPDSSDPDAFFMEEGSDYCPKCINRQFKLAESPPKPVGCLNPVPES